MGAGVEELLKSGLVIGVNGRTSGSMVVQSGTHNGSCRDDPADGLRST